MASRESKEISLRTVCQFLALSDEGKLKFLPPVREGVKYMFNESGDQTENPLFFYANAIYELTDRYRGSAEVADVVAEINCVIDLMIGYKDIAFIWYLDKRAMPVWGNADRLWRVLQRLAISVLEKMNWPQAFPEVPFARMTWSGIIDLVDPPQT